ncbi:MAG: hypothetical protein AABY95_08325 [Pseudomonadota bacterium]
MSDATESATSTWQEDVGIYIAVASFLLAALTTFTALEVFLAVTALYSGLSLLLLIVETPLKYVVWGAAIQYSLLSAMVMPFFAAFQPSFWPFVGLYSAAWWIFLFLLSEVQSRASPRKDVDKTGHAYLGMLWLMCIPFGGIVRIIWQLVRS